MSRTGKRAHTSAAEILVEAGAVMASSLDPGTAMGRIAQVAVPRFADLCVIDVLDRDGEIREAGVAAVDDGVARALEAIRSKHPLRPDGPHPAARVIRTGEPLLLPDLPDSLLRSFAEGSEHARFMIDLDYRSAVVAPLTARGRTLGALSALRLGESEPFGAQDKELAGELALRAALAIDNARLFSELRGVEQRLQAILTSLAEAVTVVDQHGSAVFANDAALELLGADALEQITGAVLGGIANRFLRLDENGRELSLDAMPGRRLLAGEAPGALLIHSIVRATGEERWLNVRSSLIADPDSGQPRFAVNVFEDITEVKRAQLTERFMSEASRVLSSSMDYRETLRRITRLAVPEIADWCAVDVLCERGPIERVAVHHADHGKLELAQQLQREYPPDSDAPYGVAEVIRTGESRVYPDVSADALAAHATGEQHRTLLAALGLTSMVIVPVIAPAKGPIGAITLASSESLRRLSQADVTLAERLARRTGSAIEHARLYEARTEVARILQSALVPESLPDVPGVEIEALYSPAGEVNDVGGDFYDVFRYDDERWMLVIGDVCGKGSRAAGVTGLARHTLRAGAMSGRTPVEMLELLHQALRRQPPGSDLCTVCLITLALEGERARLSVTLAGHEAPLLIDASGEVAELGERGTLLGVIDPLDLTEVDALLEPGQTLLLFTDGLIDAGQPRTQLGAEGLIEICEDAAELPLRALLGRLERAALERAAGRLRDDIALLTLRLEGAPTEHRERARIAPVAATT